LRRTHLNIIVLFFLDLIKKDKREKTKIKRKRKFLLSYLRYISEIFRYAFYYINLIFAKSYII